MLRSLARYHHLPGPWRPSTQEFLTPSLRLRKDQSQNRLLPKVATGMVCFNVVCLRQGLHWTIGFNSAALTEGREIVSLRHEAADRGSRTPSCNQEVPNPNPSRHSSLVPFYILLPSEARTAGPTPSASCIGLSLRPIQSGLVRSLRQCGTRHAPGQTWNRKLEIKERRE
ncbi:hypothetical protein N657DRAFT_643007 [Parathielavia appendiculata]|uniref:Uncharacterized protein n=1 Tax=Parathielavia appendiculata TaxID=2587402 RepID=A0AAN6U4D1_9PEZI|nr:hypothetical protein N657DRAFT_643007 [Parathielavia appendiculata]